MSQNQINTAYTSLTKGNRRELAMVAHVCNPSISRSRRIIYKFKGNLVYIIKFQACILRPCLKKQTRTAGKTHR